MNEKTVIGPVTEVGKSVALKAAFKRVMNALHVEVPKCDGVNLKRLWCACGKQNCTNTCCKSCHFTQLKQYETFHCTLCKLPICFECASIAIKASEQLEELLCFDCLRFVALDLIPKLKEEI